MQRTVNTAACLLLGFFVASVAAQPEFARSKPSVRAGKAKLTAARTVSLAAKPDREPEVRKVILVLQTRDHRVTVLSSGGQELRYSVATHQGIALAEALSVTDLKSSFPELHEVVTGIAWAGH